MSYARLKRVLVGLGAGYVIAGALAAAAPGFEVFPFFCWFLFPVTPNVETRYELIIHTLSGQDLDEPADIQTLGLIADPYAMDLWVSTQALGWALEQADEAQVQTIRRRFERNYLPAPSRWSVDKVVYDPLERYLTGRVHGRSVLRTVTSSVGCEAIPWPSPS